MAQGPTNDQQKKLTPATKAARRSAIASTPLGAFGDKTFFFSFVKSAVALLRLHSKDLSVKTPKSQRDIFARTSDFGSMV